MFHAEVELRREIWECVSYIRFFTENPDGDMRGYYRGKLVGIKTMLQYVDPKTLSDQEFTGLGELIATTILST